MLRHVSLMCCCCPSSDVAAIVLRVLEFRFICFSMYSFFARIHTTIIDFNISVLLLPVNQYPASDCVTLIQLFSSIIKRLNPLIGLLDVS